MTAGKGYPNSKCKIAVLSIRAEVTAQADYVILNSGKSELFVQIKVTEKYIPAAKLCYVALECHWNTQLKIWLKCWGLY